MQFCKNLYISNAETSKGQQIINISLSLNAVVLDILGLSAEIYWVSPWTKNISVQEHFYLINLYPHLTHFPSKTFILQDPGLICKALILHINLKYVQKSVF